MTEGSKLFLEKRDGVALRKREPPLDPPAQELPWSSWTEAPEGQPIRGVQMPESPWGSSWHAGESGKFTLKFSPLSGPSSSDSVAW